MDWYDPFRRLGFDLADGAMAFEMGAALSVDGLFQPQRVGAPTPNHRTRHLHFP